MAAVTKDVANNAGMNLAANILFGALGKAGQVILGKVLKGQAISRAEGEALSNELVEVGKGKAAAAEIPGERGKRAPSCYFAKNR